MTPEERRRKRLAELAAHVELNSPCAYRELIAWAILRWGSRRETVERYLEDLDWAGLVSVSKEQVVWIGK